jgi:hypothetical protein
VIRQTFNLLAGLSLVLFVVILAAWSVPRVYRKWKYPFVNLSLFPASSPFDSKGPNDTLTINDVPKAIRALDGSRVSVTGFMIPLDTTNAITNFAVIRNGEGWGYFPMLQTVIARARPGSAFPFYEDRIRVSGTVHVSVVRDTGYVVSVIEMRVDRVDPAAEPAPVLLWISGGCGAGFALLGWIASRLLARWRGRRGLCVGCGYDLRETRDQCPECGLVRAG